MSISKNHDQKGETSVPMLQVQNVNEELIKNTKKDAHDLHSKSIQGKIEYAWYNATVGPVFFFFLAAYMLQTFLVETYIEDELKWRHNFTSCNAEIIRIARKNVSKSLHNGRLFKNESNDSVEACLEEYENENSYWDLILLIIYAVPCLILAPLLGLWTDGLHRVLPMYACALGMSLSSMCMAMAILAESSIRVVVICTLPSGLTGGAVLFTLAMYSYEAEKHDNFEIFESYLTLQFIYVAAKTFVQFLIHYSASKLAKAALIWGPFLLSFFALFGLVHRRIKDKRPIKFKCRQFTFIQLPKDFFDLIHGRLLAFHIMLFLCAFVYYFAYVGETAEIMTILNHNEPWEIASFSIYGAVQGVTKSVGLLVTLFFWKNIIHKKIIDKQLLPHFSVFVLGILGYVSDMITKLAVTVTSERTIQYWEPLIGVISELAIVVVRYFLVIMVSKNDVGKVLSLVAIAQIISAIPGSISAKAIQTATLHWWPNFVYMFLALVQFIPIALLLIIMKFANLPKVNLYPAEVEDEKNTVEKLHDEK